MENEDKLLIEKLLALGREHAGKHLRNTGQMPALFFGFSDEDRVMLRPQTLEDAQDKLRFMSLARLICIAHDLDAVAFVAWVWAVEAAADEPPDTPPEESLYRKECVVVSCETRNSILQTVLLPVVRADNGAYFGLGEPEYSSTGSIQGRLTPFMPSHKPTESDRQRARQILQALTHEPPGGDN